MTEIGSEFHYEELIKRKTAGFCSVRDVYDDAYVFSGRTAIEAVLKNLPHIRKVMLPSYCCDSMIDPFRKANIESVYYQVNYDAALSIHVVIPEDVDLLLWCNYFGFKLEMPDMSEFLQRGGIIVEDITHSFFSSEQCDIQSHYLVASLRKWGPLLSGGYCACKKGRLKYKPTGLPSIEYVTKKREAMILKRAYLSEKEEIEKELFLNKFSESNSWLAENYSQLKIDDESRAIIERLDWQEVARIRRRNATILYEGLKDIPNIKFLFKEEDMDCPLFVPIILEKCKRDSIRKILTENEIYCPIHWPKPNANCVSNLYDMELSLVCDQRYDENDMQRIIDVISRWNDAQL